MNNLQNDGWDLSDLKYIDLSESEAETYRLEKGDILFNRTNGSRDLVGKCDVFREEGHWVFASYLIRVRLDDSIADPDFVSLFLNTRAGRIQIERVSRQILMSNINTEELRALQIPLPPLPLQRSMVKDMEKAKEAGIRKLAQADALLAGMDGFVLDALGITLPRDLSKRYFAVRLADTKARLDPDFNGPLFRSLRTVIEASGHNVMPIVSMCVSITSGFAAGKDDQAEDAMDGIPHLRPLNLNIYGELSVEPTKYVPQDKVAKEDLCTQYEVLLNNTNSTEMVGKTAVFDMDQPCACSNHMTRLTLKEGINPYFVAALFNSLRGLGLFGLLATNFNNQAGINTATLSSLRLPVPKKDEQDRIAQEILHRRSEARRLRAEAEAEWSAAKARFEAALLGST